MIRAIATTIVVVLSIGIVVAGMRSAATATEAARRDRAMVNDLAADVDELKLLRGHRAWIAPAQRPATGMIGQVSESLVRAGLSADVLASLTPQQEGRGTVVGGTRYGRQSFRLRMEPLTLPDLGRWLSEWKVWRPQWTVSAIELTPLIRAGEQLRPGQRPSLRANLTIEAVFVAASAPERRESK